MLCCNSLQFCYEALGADDRSGADCDQKGKEKNSAITEPAGTCGGQGLPQGQRMRVLYLLSPPQYQLYRERPARRGSYI